MTRAAAIEMMGRITRRGGFDCLLADGSKHAPKELGGDTAQYAVEVAITRWL